MEKKYDVIVVGSGLGGLSVASLLAKQEKKKVLVLEQHYLFGGYATSFKREGHEIDISLHQTGGLKTTFYKKILEKCGVLNKIKWIQHPCLYQTIGEDGSWHDFHNADMKKNKKDLYRRYPKLKDKFSIWFWYAAIWTTGKQLAIWEYCIHNFFLNPLAKFFAPIFFPLVVFSQFIPIQFWLPKKNNALRKELFHLKGYFGDKIKGMNMQAATVALYGYYYDGGASAEGGGQAISNEFVNVIKENNGELKKNRTVEEILVEDGKVTGVKTHRGETFYADHVICNANPVSVLKKMLPQNLVKNKLQGFSKKRISMTAEVLYLVLDCPIEKLNPKFKDCYEIGINLPDEKEIVITLQSNVYGKEKADGKSVLNIFKIGEYDEWQNLDEDQYLAKKKDAENKMLKILEKHLPKIKQHIIVSEYATPKTMQRYTLNEKGAIYGWAQDQRQAGFSRSLKTKVKNLYFSSAWTFPSGGYEGAIRAGNYIFDKYFCRKEKRRKKFFLLCLVGFVAYQVNHLYHIVSSLI